MLRRTEEKAEARRKQRLEDYYVKNYQDYFNFEAGDARTGAARGITPDSQAAVERWLDRAAARTEALAAGAGSSE
jgi:predicted metal-dependent phosphoesterase TrpH